jgi:GNAT superfamily N-acetyltransferase
VEGVSPDKSVIQAPQPLASHHVLDTFDCGVASLDDWLKRRARRNEVEGASRTFVACVDASVIGYYSLAAGSVLHEIAAGKVRRNMPDPAPVILLGRLAVDRRWQGRGIAADLLSDAVLRTLGAAETVGVRAMLVHALSEEAKRFYEKHGFRVSPVEPLTLMILMDEGRKMLG